MGPRARAHSRRRFRSLWTRTISARSSDDMSPGSTCGGRKGNRNCVLAGVGDPRPDLIDSCMVEGQVPRMTLDLSIYIR